MCGIFGFYNQQFHALTQQTFLSMGATIRHRGPDGEGYYYSQNKAVGIGNERLAILDIENGSQPFSSSDGNIHVVQNGEIFNHIELAKQLKQAGFACRTHCDTEVILKLYEQGGIEALTQLNGMFAIAIYDQRIDTLYLIRDRAGEKPLYWYQDASGSVLFASEIKAILQVSGQLEYCPDALNALLCYNYVPPPATLFKGVKHVPAGHFLRINRGSISTHCWWDLANTQSVQLNEHEHIDNFLTQLDDAVRIRLRADVPFGAFLSGGVDSSTIVGLMSQHMSRPVKTFSIGFDDPRFDESPFALEAATRFNCEHHCEIVNPDMLDKWQQAIYFCDQPHGDISFLPTWRVAQMAAQHVKMVLTGDGADELFAGYDKYKNFFEKEGTDLSNDTFFKKYAANITLFNASHRNSLLTEKITKQLSYEPHEKFLKPLFNKSQHMDHINQALYFDMQLLLSGNNLVKPDRMGMAESIENRAPFLDHRVMQAAFSMHGSMKLFQGETKYIYKKAVQELIGSNLAYRKKQMFTVPVGNWFKDKLKPLCQDLLLSRQVTDREIFNATTVEKLFNDHCTNQANNTREIRLLMAIELWFREFFD